MIPKIIHYCWFGGNPLPDDVKQYIVTWRKFCSDYEIIEWNESNFDVTQNEYCKEAYEAKKWAFVTDYVRLKVLYEYGGIYMDTDVEVVKSLDSLLTYNALSGYESPSRIPTGTMGACRDNEWIGILLQDYNHRHFIKSDGSFNLMTNVEVITQLTTERYGIHLDGNKIEFGNHMVLLPFDYLCAKDLKTSEIRKTSNTYTIHHFMGSWLPEDIQVYSQRFRKYYADYADIPAPDFIKYNVAKLKAAYESGGFSKIFVKMVTKMKRGL